ncbi:MAG: N-acetylneuraminate lyase [Lachnospiraceae bacterium]|nr:N-acetylneuraminate lyase [Lachnospiraceae bacterium]
MVNQAELQKIFSALIIPMNEDQSINYDALRELVRQQMKDGVEGFYCCGSSGEGLLLTTEERKRVVEEVLDEVAGAVPVIAHVGTIRTADAIELAQHAKDAGAKAVSMIPPYYYHFTMDEILSYYEDVLNAVPGFPGIIYNIPQFTGIEFNKVNAKRLLDNPDMIGIKHTSQNLYAMERMHTAYPEKVIFNGFDEQFLGALSMGSTATIGTTVNLFAPLFLKVRELYQAGNFAEALKVQEQINLRVEAMVSVGIFNAVKYAWTLRGVDCGMCRSPFKPMTDEQKKVIEELMA